MKSSILILCLAVLSVPLVSSGQQDKDKPAVKAEILTICDAGFIKDLNYTSSEKGGQTMSIYSRGFSSPIDYKGAAELVFFRPKPTVEGFAKTEPDIVGKVTLPLNTSHILLLFERDTDKKDEAYRIFALDNNLKRFPAGSYRFFNSSRVPLFGYLGKTKFEIAPNKAQIITATGLDEFNNVELRFFKKDKESGKVENIYNSVWNIKESRRSTVFITPSKSRVQELNIRKVVEPIVKEEEQAP